MDALSIIGALTLGVFTIAAIVGILQLKVLQVRHRLDTAPFVTLHIGHSISSIPTGRPNLDVEIVRISEFEKWAKTKPKARHRYVVIVLQNRQGHIAGVATDVTFRLVFKFPKHGSANTMIKYRRYYTKGSIYLEPNETYRFICADLKGVPACTIDADQVKYYDIEGNQYTRGYGFTHWELGNTGVESGEFRSYS